jgi:hypothetical protein
VKVQYTAIFKSVGASKLPEGAECTSLLTLQSPVLAAVLTMNPDPYSSTDNLGLLEYRF